MIVSHEWLKQFVPHGLSANEIGELLSRHCVTLDGLELLGGALAPFVIAQVVVAGKHPNSDHLWVTKVDDGSGMLLDVVCGAPNVVAGHKYPFARTGTVMPGGLKIEKRKIRGQTSNGMLCSPRELGLGQDHDGIMTMETDAVPGTPLLEVLSLADARLALDVLPNRPDLLSHRGVAREIAAITGVPATPMPATDLANVVASFGEVSGSESASADGVSVGIEDAVSCPAYLAMVIRGVTVGPSPAWLVQRLESIGQRSISNVVDATNYVLHGLGQPVHAFDLSTLSHSAIVVRSTRPGEALITLDGIARSLPTGTTVICDGVRPVALAGIMGGRPTEVTTTTRDVLLEVAHFDTRFVRRVRRMVGLSTDASYRFERGIDAGALREVAVFAAALIVQVAGGRTSAMISVGSAPTARNTIMLRPGRLAHVLGAPVSAAESTARLEVLGCTVAMEGDALAVTPPSWRHDLLYEVDLIEEVGRLIGFDTLPNTLRAARPSNAPDDPLLVAGRRVRDVLVALGLAEVRPMPFTATGTATTPRVRNPLADDEPFLRATLLDTLARRVEYNLSRMQGNVRLFEVGNAFLPSAERLPREELHVAAVVMGARRPLHFTEPRPPSFDMWDAKAIAERVIAAAFPGALHRCVVGDDNTIWILEVEGHGAVGHVSRVSLDSPVWASACWGVEVRLGVLPSHDVAPAGAHAHGAFTAVEGGSLTSTSSMRVRSLPTTPAAEFDLALIVPDTITAADVEDAMKRSSGDLLERLTLFDEFRGAGVPSGFRSVAWRLTFRHPGRTLKEKEIEGRRLRLLESLMPLGVTTRAT